MIDGRISARKSPDVDHHPLCVPHSRSEIDVLEVDREMRARIQSTGKRPRQAYTDTLASVPKRSLRPAMKLIQSSVNSLHMTTSVVSYNVTETTVMSLYQTRSNYLKK